MPRSAIVTAIVALAIAVLAASSPALSLEGRILLPDGRPAADATVSILGRPGSIRADADGRFTWLPDPPAPFEILVVLPGGRYAAPIRVLAVPKSGVMTLTARPLAEESVTVTADAAPNTEAPPGAAASAIPVEDLLQRRPARLADAIENVPGAGRLDASHDAVPSLRGLARGRTLLLLDGQRITTERRAGASAGFIDPFFLETIEITRGPGSVAYGSDALGGVLHARSRQAKPGLPWALRWTASGATGVPETSGGVELARGFDEGGFLVQARARTFGDYRSPEGDVDNSSADDRGFLGRVDHEMGPGRLAVAWRSDLARDVERPDADPAQRVVQPREDSHRLSFEYQIDPTEGGTVFAINGLAGWWRRDTVQERVPPGGGAPDAFTSELSAQDWGLRALMIRPVGRARLEAGVDLNGRAGLEASGKDPFLGETTSVEDASRTDLALYASTEVALARAVLLSAGLRGDAISTRNDGGSAGDRSTHDAALSGVLGVTAGPFTGFTFSGQVARGFRDPSLSDRYFAGISGRGFVTGQPELDPESSLQYDAAVRWSERKLRAALYAYDYRIDDLIERFQSGTDPNSGLDLFTFRNRGSARLRGVELETAVTLLRRWTLEVAAQQAWGEAEDGSPLADIPVRSLIVQVRHEILETGYLYARAAASGRNARPGPTEQATAGFGLLDVGGGWRWGRRLEARLIVRNLLDHEYVAGVDERAALAPGRSALLTLGGTFGG